MTEYVSARVSLTEMDFPVGTILMWPFSTSPPTGWLLCDGGSFSTTIYPALAAVVGSTYGGSGKVPNMNSGSVPLGKGTTYTTLATTGGAATVTLTANQTGTKSHYHKTYDASTNGYDFAASGSNDQGVYNNVDAGGATSAASATASSHNNLQPYISMYFIIKAAP